MTVALPAGRSIGRALMYYVYILRSKKDNKFYTGITDDIEKRLKQHNIGYKATRSTVNRGPFNLIFIQECENRSNARELEKFFKSGFGREIRDEMLK